MNLQCESEILKAKKKEKKRENNFNENEIKGGKGKGLYSSIIESLKIGILLLLEGFMFPGKGEVRQRFPSNLLDFF